MRKGVEMGENTPTGLRVECYAGHRAEEEPRRFFIGEREIIVAAILDRWLAPAHRYFKVQGSDGGIYILRHDLRESRWELILYDRGHAGVGRLSST